MTNAISMLRLSIEINKKNEERKMKNKVPKFGTLFLIFGNMPEKIIRIPTFLDVSLHASRNQYADCPVYYYEQLHAL